MDQDIRRLRRRHLLISLLHILVGVAIVLFGVWRTLTNVSMIRRRRVTMTRSEQRRIERIIYLNRITSESYTKCRSELRMNRQSFFNLCEMLRGKGGLKGTRNTPLEEIVARFVNTLAHHKKNRTLGVDLLRSGETISRQFQNCLQAMLRLHEDLFKTPTPIGDNCMDPKWKSFKNCLGALDGTHISVNPPSETRQRYRTRKGELTMNVLAACAPDMQFIYVLSGWEGSAHDARVLKDAISKDFKVAEGCYYLVDAGYANAKGFLSPYRRQRYHLREWEEHQPQSAEEFFNMQHSKARSTIERCFGVLKKQWSVLRSPTFFPIRTQSRIIYACCLLYNFIRKINQLDEQEEEDEDDFCEEEEDEEDDVEMEFITSIESTDEWTSFRNQMAQDMFNGWRARN